MTSLRAEDHFLATIRTPLTFHWLGVWPYCGSCEDPGSAPRTAHRRCEEVRSAPGRAPARLFLPRTESSGYLQTDNASWTFFRQDIVDLSASGTDNASWRLVAELAHLPPGGRGKATCRICAPYRTSRPPQGYFLQTDQVRHFCGDDPCQSTCPLREIGRLDSSPGPGTPQPVLALAAQAEVVADARAALALRVEDHEEELLVLPMPAIARITQAEVCEECPPPGDESIFLHWVHRHRERQVSWADVARAAAGAGHDIGEDALRMGYRRWWDKVGSPSDPPPAA